MSLLDTGCIWFWCRGIKQRPARADRPRVRYKGFVLFCLDDIPNRRKHVRGWDTVCWWRGRCACCRQKTVIPITGCKPLLLAGAVRLAASRILTGCKPLLFVVAARRWVVHVLLGWWRWFCCPGSLDDHKILRYFEIIQAPFFPGCKPLIIAGAARCDAGCALCSWCQLWVFALFRLPLLCFCCRLIPSTQEVLWGFASSCMFLLFGTRASRNILLCPDPDMSHFDVASMATIFLPLRPWF